MEKMAENYIEYVTKVIKQYTEASNLITEENEVTPQALDTALALYLPTSASLLSEYQRAKIDHFSLENEYNKWYDSIFVKEREKLTSDLESKSLKISVKEIETYIRNNNSKEFYEWQEKLKTSEYKISFLRRVLEQYKKFDAILIALSNNMRTEVRSLSLDARMNSQDKVEKYKVRASF
jgi:hypothetical protein